MESKISDIKSLKIIRDFFAGEEFNYWLDSGSLLGLIRDNRFIESDGDVDLGIWNEPGVMRKILKSTWLKRKFKFKIFYWKGRIFKIELVPRNFNSLKIHLQPYILQEPENLAVLFRPISKFYLSPLKFAETTEGTGDSESSVNRQINSGKTTRKTVGFTRKFLAKIARLRRRLSPGSFLKIFSDKQLLEFNWPFSVWLDLLYHEWGWYIPADYFQRPVTVEIDGTEFPVPRDPEDYLTARYGDWKTPVADWSYYTDDRFFHKKSLSRHLEEDL